MRLEKRHKLEILLANQNLFENIFYEIGHPSDNGIDMLHPKEYACCAKIVKPEETAQIEEHHKFTMYNHSKSFEHKIHEYNDENDLNLSQEDLIKLVRSYALAKQIMKENKMKTIEEFYDLIREEPENNTEAFYRFFVDLLLNDEELKYKNREIFNCLQALLDETEAYYGSIPNIKDEDEVFDFMECFKKIVKKTIK